MDAVRHPYDNPGIETCGVHPPGTSTLSIRRELVCGGSSRSELGPLLMLGFIRCIPGQPAGIAHVPRVCDNEVGYWGLMVFGMQHGICLYLLVGLVACPESGSQFGISNASAI